MKKKRIIIYIDDNCDEDFNHVDVFHIQKHAEDMLMAYDVEITKIEIKEEDEVRPA